MTAASNTQAAGDGFKTPQEAANLIEQFGRIMDSLVETVERETALVREGKLSEAGTLEAVKAELSREYQAGTAWFKRNNGYLKSNLPALLKALHRRHDEFRAVLQINLTVLATAQAVSESIIRGVSGEMARKQSPQTYGASGKANTPGPRASQPISVSRSL
ncbi:MAG: hypothetical protein AB7T86_15530 [Xanthobacteraceae bacterium]|uniref:hypothetical protein n=1 Tax=Pseudolabrys sp. TaxID=1960880 RepID=UPI003D144182